MKSIVIYVLLILVVIASLAFLFHKAGKVEPWDGTFQCRPGETYTVKECP